MVLAARYAGRMAPLVTFDDGEQEQIIAAAKTRQKAAVLYWEGRHPGVTEEDALEWNTIRNHLRGEAAERAVSKWLDVAKVQHTRSKSVVEEMCFGEADIVTAPHGVKIDVKSQHELSEFMFYKAQWKEDPWLAIVWCGIVYDDVHRGDPGDALVAPRRVSILSWSTLADIKQIDRERVDALIADNRTTAEKAKAWKTHRVRANRARPLRPLLHSWIIGGKAP